ncbi:MAG: DsbA family protein [bacterium]|nr:DsbA family protein [bacterium]
MKNTFKIRFSVALAAVFGLIGAAYTLNLPNGQPVQAQKMKQGESVKDIKDLHADGILKDMAVGKADAPVTIIEYSSLTCPHCASFHKNVLPELKSKYIDTGKVRYVVREFPLDNLAVAGFMLARCKSDKYNEIVEDLYMNQEAWAFVKDPLEKLKERAKKAGYTDESFNSCLRDQALLDKIVKVREKASTVFKVSSTPTLFVNGKLLRGASHIRQIEELMGDKAK